MGSLFATTVSVAIVLATGSLLGNSVPPGDSSDGDLPAA
jgi:hypothetical protein